MKFYSNLIAVLVVVYASCFSYSQILTKEDSLSAGLIASNNATVISGYGNFLYSKNFTLDDATANVDRMILFIGHKFNKRISFFSETEIEDAGVQNGKLAGSLSLEQLFLKFNIDRNNYIVTGLFIPRIGIINENHLPTTFNGNDRPYVETLVLPSTWREIGVGYYGTSNKIVGLNYSAAIMTGLHSGNFTNGTGIAGGRLSGNQANTNALALTGSLLYYKGDFRTQISGYYGGSAGLQPYQADSLELEAGMFGTPVSLLEANTQYQGNRLGVKVLGAWVNIPQANLINRAYANNTPEQMLGAYLDISYAFFKREEKQANVFSRYEYINMNMKLPNNGIYNGLNDQQYLLAGLSFNPIHGVMIKAEYIYRMTGDINPALIVVPYPLGQPYFMRQHFLKIGVGYSF